jgi:hypothetical protein
MADNDPIGPSVGPFTLERAILTLLQTPPAGGAAPLLVYYLADQERQLGLPAKTLPTPSGPESYIGGIDADSFTDDLLPAVHVVVTPSGTPKKLDMDTYSQAWQVVLTATADGIGADNEETGARITAACYGTALSLLIAQNGALGIDATHTVITRSPDSSWVDPTTRSLARSSVTFETLTAPSLTFPGPTSWPSDPYTTPPPYPQISTVDVTVDAVPAD